MIHKHTGAIGRKHILLYVPNILEKYYIDVLFTINGCAKTLNVGAYKLSQNINQNRVIISE